MGGAPLRPDPDPDAGDNSDEDDDEEDGDVVARQTASSKQNTETYVS